MAKANEHIGFPWWQRLTAATAWGHLFFLLLLWIGIRLIAERYWLLILFAWAPPILYLLLWLAVSALDLAARRKRAVLPATVSGLVIVFLFSGLCWHLTPRPAAGLKALTLNIRAGLGGPEAIGRYLAAQKVDVMALQEARVPSAGKGPDPTPLILAQMDGWNVVRGGRKDELVIATHHAILSSQAYPLNEWSKVLEAIIEIDGKKLRVLAVHCVMGNPRNTTPAGLELSARARHQQGAEIARIVGTSTLPTLLLGDFNTPPDSVLYKQIANGMTDSFRTAGWGFGWTFSQDRPLLRIDYIWSRGLTPSRSRVFDSQLSDHRGVISEFAWPGQ